MFCIYFSRSKTQRHFFLLQQRHIFPQTKVIYWNSLKQEPQRWCPPAQGWYKVNVDGAVFAD